MVGSISTLASNNAIVARMLNLEQSVNTDQQQMSSGLKSQDYVGIAPESYQLLNVEGQIGRLTNYQTNNALVTTNLQTQLTAVQGVTDQAQTIQTALVQLSGQDLSAKSPTDITTVNDIQQKAFAALNQITFFLNQQVDGQYIFGGGVSNTPPVSFPYGSLAAFQQTFNGTSTVFPSTAVADSTDIGFNNASVTYTPQTINGTNYTEIDGGSPDQFVTQSLNTANFGSLNFTNVGSNGVITASSPGAFSSVQIGQTIMIDGTASGTGNNGIYTVTSVSPDGGSITLDQNVNTGVEAAGTTATLNLTVPNGTTMALTGSTNGNNGPYTVTWPTNAQLQAAGFNFSVDGSGLLSGSTLFVDPPVPSPTPETVSLNSTSFLTGANVMTSQKISDTQTIQLSTTALDPAFEKVIRGLGILAEGDLIDNTSRINQALSLVNDGLAHSALDTTEAPSDLTGVQDRLSLSLKTLTETNDQQTELKTFLQQRQNTINQADPTQTAVQLQADSNALQVSYAALARIQKLSLLDYL